MPLPTIYARVPEELKQATDDYADEHGMSLASAVTDLLGRGLEASANQSSVLALEGRVQDLQRELSRVHDTAGTVCERLKQVLGKCACGTDLTGHDLLVVGRCPNCSRGVSGLLGGSERDGGSVDRNEFAPFLAGLGVALAIILIAYGSSR